MICKINGVRTVILLFLLVVGFVSCNKTKEKIPPMPFGGLAITATLNNLQTSASTTATANGSMAGHFDKSTFTLSFTVNWSSLSNVPTKMQLQGGTETPVYIAGFSSSRNGTLYSSVRLPGNASDDLVSGNFYFTISTVTYPKGEISGQIIAK